MKSKNNIFFIFVFVTVIISVIPVVVWVNSRSKKNVKEKIKSEDNIYHEHSQILRENNDPTLALESSSDSIHLISNDETNKQMNFVKRESSLFENIYNAKNNNNESNTNSNNEYSVSDVIYTSEQKIYGKWIFQVCAKIPFLTEENNNNNNDTNNIYNVFEEYDSSEFDSLVESNKLSIPSSDSVGSSISIIDNYIFIGAPEDDDYGKVYLFYVSDKKIRFSHCISFSHVGSLNQKSGKSLCKNIATAPDFHPKKHKHSRHKIPKGTLFLMKNWDNPNKTKIKELSIHLKNDLFELTDDNNVFIYNYPWLCVTKSYHQKNEYCQVHSTNRFQKVYIYKFQDEHTLTFIQVLESFNKDIKNKKIIRNNNKKICTHTYGKFIYMNKYNDCLSLFDPINQFVDIFIYYPKNKSPWRFYQRIDLQSSTLVENIKNLNKSHYYFQSSVDGTIIAIGDSVNQYVLLLYWDVQKIEFKEFQIIQNSKKLFGSFCVFNKTNEWICITDNANSLFFYKFDFKEKKYDFYEELVYNENLMFNSLYWSDIGLLVISKNQQLINIKNVPDHLNIV
jgi:hypothetical protein